MATWRKSMTFCDGCRRWRTDQAHKNCPYGTRGSLVWVNLDNLRSGCNKCNETWPLESSVMHCSCGHVQHTEYDDTSLTLAVGDEVIGYDGDLVYVRRRSGVVSVGYRSYLNQSYA